MQNDLICAADADHLTALVLLDLSSAFDTVDHNIRSSVLDRRFGVDGIALQWFPSNLEDWMQMFVVNENRSSTYHVNCSVPQGSVLGPLKFISYTENVTLVFKRHNIHHHVFADDM